MRVQDTGIPVILISWGDVLLGLKTQVFQVVSYNLSPLDQ